MKDLTVGNEGKQILFFSLPMLIGSVLQQLYNVTDSIIVGNFVGKEALAAVGAGFPIMFFLIALIMGVGMGGMVLISQFYGAKDMKNLKKMIDTLYIFIFFMSLTLMIIGLVFSERILILLNTPKEILPLAKSYLDVIFIGVIFLFGYNTFSAVLRGLGDSKNPLYFLIISVIINIFLDLLFIIKLGWGVAGAAWATIISNAISVVIMIIYLNKNNPILHINIKNMKFNFQLFKKSIQIGLPTGVQQMLVSIGMMVLITVVNSFGTDTIAAFTAASRIDSFAMMPVMNFSMAISTFVGQNIGAKKKERVNKGYLYTLGYSISLSLLISLGLYFFGDKIVGLFNNDANVKKIGQDYLVIVSSFYALFSIMFVTNGVLRGAGDTFIPMINTVLSLWLLRVPLSIYLSGKFGYIGIWWSIPTSWAFGALFTMVYYFTGRWKKKNILSGIKMTVPEDQSFEEGQGLL